MENFCIQSGVPPGSLRLLPIRSGRNSAVFKVSSEGGNWILKHYYQHDADKRNRLASEYQFLTFLNQAGCRSVAKPITCDNRKQFALHSFLNGGRPSIITDMHIDQSAQFIILLHHLSDHPNAQAIENAADSCFDLEQHACIVDARFKEFDKVQTDCVESIEFLNWVKNVLKPAWKKIRSYIFSPQVNPTTQQLILSPSDFGFHNTLEYEGRLSFIDFEYSGWDSIAKLACDFICQPELPVTEAQALQFLTKLAQETNSLSLIDQVNILLPLHRIKWCCILLNVFRDVDRQRRIHSGSSSSDILSEQLYKTKIYFETNFQNL